MAKSFEERQKERIVKQIRTHIVADRWYWRGVEFCSWRRSGLPGAEAYTCFTAKYNALKVTIETEHDYNIPDQSCEFVGENAMEEAVSWTAERLLEIYKTVSFRAAPFEKGHIEYLKAIRGQ